MEQDKYEETTKKIGNSVFVLVPRQTKKNLGLNNDGGDKVEIIIRKVQ